MLLRVVEYQRFERVQGTETIQVDVRIIAASNADLEALMDRGEFRRDLYDRLAFKEIRVPPLRERLEDVPQLVEYFLAELAREVPGLGAKKLTRAALAGLRQLEWPGNVRQLKYTVERLALDVGGDRIDAADLKSPSRAGEVAGDTFHGKVESLQKGLLRQALSASNGIQRAAAGELGLTYDQFRHYYRKFGLKGDR